MLVLSILTCGIYYLYFVYASTKECNEFTRRDEMSPGTEIVLIIVTCGIWDIYWDYRMGKRLVEMGQMVGLQITDNAILYVILDVLQFGFINALIQQETMNRIWAAAQNPPPPPNYYYPPYPPQGPPSDGPYYRQ